MMSSKEYDKAYDAGKDKGLAEGHYQADSMMQEIVSRGNKHGACSKSTVGAGKAYGGKAGLKK